MASLVLDPPCGSNSSTRLAPRPRDRFATRARILEAARDAFARTPYEQVGIRSIASDAGVDAALIPRYFGTKENLLAEVLKATAPPRLPPGSCSATLCDRLARAAVSGQWRPVGLDGLAIALRSGPSFEPSALYLIASEKQLGEWFFGPDPGAINRARSRILFAVLAGFAALDPEGISVPSPRSANENEGLARILSVGLQRLVDAAD